MDNEIETTIAEAIEVIVESDTGSEESYTKLREPEGETEEVQSGVIGGADSLEAEEGSTEPEELTAAGMDLEMAAQLIEALLFANGEAMSLLRLEEVTGLNEERLREVIESIQLRYRENGSGIDLVEVGNKLQLRTKAEFAPFIRKIKAEAPRRLSSPALETLSIVAYRQPIVKSDIEKIRGVDATPTIKTLLDRNLIKIVGHQGSVGQPALYGTTDEFLEIFGLRSLGDLPSLREVNEIESDPGELQESAPA